MARRKRSLHPPILPGFWPLLALTLLVLSVLGWFWILGKNTRLERQPVAESAAPASKKAAKP